MYKASTIFEKAKRGEITNNGYSRGGYSSYYSGFTSRFSQLSFYKKPDIIKPYLHYSDAHIVQRSVQKYIESRDFKMSKASSNILKAFNSEKKKKGVEQMSMDTYQNEIRKIYDKFPSSLLNDMHNQFYADNYSLKYEDRTQRNKRRFNILDRINDPVSKIITNGSQLKSMIYTRYMTQYFLTMMLEIKANNPDDFNEMMKNLANSGADGSGKDKDPSFDKSTENILDKYLSDKNDSKSKLDEFKQAAKDDIDNLQQTMSNEEIDEIWGNDAGVQSLPIELKSMFDEISDYNFNMDALKQPLKKIIEKAASKFKSEKEYFYDSFIDDPMVSELIDHAYLHPKLRKLFIEDLQIKDFRTFGKIDVYVDVSGSMGSGCGFGNLSRIRFSQVLLYKLIKMDAVDKIFLFNNSVREIKTDVKAVMKIGYSGGTSFNNVAKHIKNRDAANVLMITDCDDSLYEYLPNLFVLGVAGSSFHGFHQDYHNTGQLIHFNGTEVRMH